MSEPVRASPIVEASRRVASIMRAAEDGAREITDDAERRADARIAEASRGAKNRVAAAEEEATEILAEARAEAAMLRQTAETETAALREAAQAEATQLLVAARSEAEDVQRIAEVFARSTRDDAQESARKQVSAARAMAGTVLADGTEMHDNLRQLAESLVRNAEMLLNDVAIAHRAMMARLEDAGVEFDPPPAPAGTSDGHTDFGVPEFIPRSPRR